MAVTESTRCTAWTRLFAAGIGLIVLGGALACWVQTSGGTRVVDVRFVGSNGTPMSALLYIPAGVSAQAPAPGILAVHGYINSREAQSGFAIEFARHGAHVAFNYFVEIADEGVVSMRDIVRCWSEAR